MDYYTEISAAKIVQTTKNDVPFIQIFDESDLTKPAFELEYNKFRSYFIKSASKIDLKKNPLLLEIYYDPAQKDCLVAAIRHNDREVYQKSHNDIKYRQAYETKKRAVISSELHRIQNYWNKNQPRMTQDYQTLENYANQILIAGNDFAKSLKKLDAKNSLNVFRKLIMNCNKDGLYYERGFEGRIELICAEASRLAVDTRFNADKIRKIGRDVLSGNESSEYALYDYPYTPSMLEKVFWIAENYALYKSKQPFSQIFADDAGIDRFEIFYKRTPLTEEEKEEMKPQQIRTRLKMAQEGKPNRFFNGRAARCKCRPGRQR